MERWGYTFPGPTPEAVEAARAMTPGQREAERARLNERISEWEAGVFAAPGSPVDGQVYSLRMREARKPLLTALAAVDIAERGT